MPLSLSKLQDLLVSKGFVPTRYYIMDGMIFYIELLATATSDIFLLYFPSKYNFSISSGKNVHKISYVTMENGENMTEEYAGNQEDLDMDELYGDVNIQLDPDKEKMEEHLEDNYKRPISIKNISNDDLITIKALQRQMKRLGYCMQNIKYKIAVFYKNYICAIRRDDSIDCFTIKHYPKVDSKRLMMIVDLETFYDKNEKLLDDIRTVRNSIYNVLERNQNTHTQVMNKMTKNRQDILMIPQQAKSKKEEYDHLLSQFDSILSDVIVAENNTLEKIRNIMEPSNEGLHTDISRAHEKGQLEKDLEEILDKKKRITNNMTIIRNKKENAILSIDKIMFDNSVMFDCMIKNFAKLKGFC